ncbi:glycosyltransferase [Aerococcus viridans]
MKKVKILYVKNGNFVKGGVETFIKNHYEFIDKSKFQIDFLIHTDSPSQNMEEIEYFKQNGSNIFFVPTRNKSIRKHILAVDSILKRGYNIIHTHTGPSAGLTLKQAKKNKIPIRIAHSHGTKPMGSSNYIEKLNWTILEGMKFMVRRYATDYFACSTDAGKYLFGKKNKEKVVLIKNAVDLSKFYFSDSLRQETRAKLNISENDFVIGQIGRFDENKNQTFSLDLLKKLNNSNFVLLFVGDGKLLPKVKKEVENLGLKDNVIFIKKSSVINKILSGIDLLILPSKHEGLPLVTIEAQASNLPIIVSKNVSSEIKLNNNIYFTDLTQPHEWVKKIMIIYKNKSTDRKLRPTKLQENGYNIEDSGNRLNNLYLKLWNEKGHKS